MTATVININTGYKINFPSPQTPKFDHASEKISRLKKLSGYNFEWDLELLRSLEIRLNSDKYRTMEKPLKSPLFSKDGQLYIDAYSYGDTHNCYLDSYHAHLRVHGLWNEPFPIMTDLSLLWATLYTAFETDQRCKHRELLKSSTVRIGKFGDSFNHLDKKYKITQEIIKMLEYYNVSYVIETRSDLIAYDSYIKLLSDNCKGIEFKIDSLDDEFNKLAEAGAPSAKRRLIAAKKLSDNGFKVYCRQQVVAPIYNLNDLHKLSLYGIKAVITIKPDITPYNVKMFKKATGIDLGKNFNSFKELSEHLNKEYDKLLPYINSICEHNNLTTINQST